MEEYIILEINVLSANDLKNANLFTKMETYAFITLSGDSRLTNHKFKTHVDRQGGNNPYWNFPVKFRINQVATKHNQLTLTFTIRCDRALGDKNVGTVVVPLKELYHGIAAADGGMLPSSTKSVTYQVSKPSGKPKGELHFSYKFSETDVVYPVGTSPGKPPLYPPVSAGYQPSRPAYEYPAQQYPGNVYPPPPPPEPGYVYPPPPPQPGYVYPPPPPAGYGYAQPQQPQNRNNMGLGLGAGLLGGVLGGVLIGDLVSDGDGGFGDGWGF